MQCLVLIDVEHKSKKTLSHLYHVDKVVEILQVVNGQLVVLINHAVVDDLSRDTDTEDIVTGMADGFSHQK